MKKLIILALVLVSQTAFAQQIRVQKIKGNKAIVEFSSDLAPGRTYSVGGGSSGNITAFFLGGSMKWFGLTNSTALRADLGYDYKKIVIGSASITSSGFALRAGISTYF